MWLLGSDMDDRLALGGRIACGKAFLQGLVERFLGAARAVLLVGILCRAQPAPTLGRIWLRWFGALVFRGHGLTPGSNAQR
jgi:hypothetical protein